MREIRDSDCQTFDIIDACLAQVFVNNTIVFSVCTVLLVLCVIFYFSLYLVALFAVWSCDTTWCYNSTQCI